MLPINPRGLKGIKVKRTFVNRTSEINSFHKMYHNSEQRQYNIMSIIGMGGIGKSRLVDELRLDITNGPWNNDTLISTVIDFDSRQFVSSIQSIDKILFLIRSEFRKQGVKFPTFDIAYTHYWEITRPDIPLRKDEVPFLSEGNFIVELFSNLKDVNSKISHFSNLISVSGILSKSISAINSVWNTARDYYTRSTVASLAELENMRPHEVASTLKFFFANDVLTHSKKHGKKILLFIDTYDSLQYNNKNTLNIEGINTQDEWLKELIAELPNAVWIIAGRQSIRTIWGTNWDQFIVEANLDILGDEESTRFLSSAGIEDNAVIRQIIKTSNGLPFSLELMADQFFIISEHRTPLPSDFEYLSEKVVERFCQYLTVQEYETLKLLSIPRFWTRGVGELLIESFNTGFSSNSLPWLGSYSFIKSDENTFYMHLLMRNSLRERLPVENISSIHIALHKYYNDQLIDLKEIVSLDEFQSIFSECLYHVSEVDIVSACDWFDTKCFDRASGELGIFMLEAANNLLSNLTRDHSTEHINYVRNLQYHIACLNYHLGRYADSEILFIEIQDFFKLADQQRYGNIQKLLSLSYMELSRYDDAISLIEDQIQTTDDQLTLASYLTTLGVLHEKKGNYDYSLNYHLKSKTIYEDQKVKDEQYVNTINNIGMAYAAKEEFQTSLDYFNEAMRVYREIGINSPIIAKITNNQGIAYRSLGNIKQALTCFSDAHNIQETIYGSSHPELARTKNNIGQMYQIQGNFELAIEYSLAALDIQNVFFRSPQEITGYIHNNLAISYQSKSDLACSLAHTKKALEIRTSLHLESNPLVISTYINLAGIHLDLGQLLEGYFALRKALILSRRHLPAITIGEIYLQVNTGRYRQKTNRPKKAIRSFIKAAEILNNFPGYWPELFYIYKDLFFEFFKTGDFDNALIWNIKWQRCAEAFQGEYSQEYIDSLIGESVIHKAKENRFKSISLLEKAYKIQIKISDLNSEKVNQIKSYLKSFEQ